MICTICVLRSEAAVQL